METPKHPTAEVVQRGTHACIQVAGYISDDAAEPLETAFRQAGDTPNILVVFDEDAFINSTGLAILFHLMLPLKDQGREIRMVHPSAHFRKVFDIVGVTRDVAVFESEEAIGEW